MLRIDRSKTYNRLYNRLRAYGNSSGMTLAEWKKIKSFLTVSSEEELILFETYINSSKKGEHKKLSLNHSDFIHFMEKAREDCKNLNLPSPDLDEPESLPTVRENLQELVNLYRGISKNIELIVDWLR